MSVTYYDVEQRSDEWYALRLGRLTASRAGDMVATHKDGKTPSTSRRNLRLQLVLERLTGRSHDRIVRSQAMQDGIDREPEAIARYEAETGVFVTPIGFVAHDRILAGCSPDGLVGGDGLISVKCPIPATHLDFLRSNVIAPDYLAQIVHECWITGRAWCDFCSYSPEFADLGLEMKTARCVVERDEVAAYERRALAFLDEVAAEVGAIRTMADVAAALRQAVA